MSDILMPCLVPRLTNLTMSRCIGRFAAGQPYVADARPVCFR